MLSELFKKANLHCIYVRTHGKLFCFIIWRCYIYWNCYKTFFQDL